MRQPANYATQVIASGSPQFVAGRCVLMGFSVANTLTTSTGTASIFDGSTTGVRLFLVNLNPSESTREWFAPNGIAIEQGLTVTRTTLTIEVCLFYVAETRLEEGLYETVESLG